MRNQCLKTVSSRVLNLLLLLLLLLLLVCAQVEDVSFTLSHPNQYFTESQKILSGGKDLKREVDTPQRSQENAAARATQGPTANTTGDLVEMTEDLDSFFQDGWFYSIEMFVFIKAPFLYFTCFMLHPPMIVSGPSRLSVFWQSHGFGVDNQSISLLSEKLSLYLLAGGWMNGGTWMEGNKQFCAVLLWLGL